MTITEAPDGWFINNGRRYYHVNQQWLDDMYRHQVKPGRKSEAAFNQLVYAFRTSDDPDTIYEKWRTFYDSTGSYEPPPPSDPTPFQQFIQERRHADSQ